MNRLEKFINCDIIDVYELDSTIKCLSTYPYFNELNANDKLIISIIILRLIKQYYSEANRLSIMTLLSNNGCLEVSSIILLYRHFNGNIEKTISTFKLLCDYRHYICITKNYRNKSLDIYKNMITRYTNEFIRINKDVNDIVDLNKIFNSHLFVKTIEHKKDIKRCKCSGELKYYEKNKLICIDCLDTFSE